MLTARMKSGLLFLGFAALVVARPGQARAEADAEDLEFRGVGSTLHPIMGAPVAVDSLELTVRQEGPALGPEVRAWRVDATYVFRSTSGKTHHVKMGLLELCPAAAPSPDAAPKPSTPKKGCADFRFDQLRVEVDGKRIRARPRKPGPHDPARVLNGLAFERAHELAVVFRPKQKRTIKTSYTFRPSVQAPDSSELKVLLRTVGLWDGYVGELKVHVAVFDRFGRLHVGGDLGAPDSKAEEGPWLMYHWNITNYRAEGDLQLRFEAPDGVMRSAALDAACAVDDASLAKLGKVAVERLHASVGAAYGAPQSAADLVSYFKTKRWYRPHPAFDKRWLSKEHGACQRRLAKAVRAKGG